MVQMLNQFVIHNSNGQISRKVIVTVHRYNCIYNYNGSTGFNGVVTFNGSYQQGNEPFYPIFGSDAQSRGITHINSNANNMELGFNNDVDLGTSGAFNWEQFILIVVKYFR